MPQYIRDGWVEMYFIYRRHLPHLLSARPESASGENCASNNASMFSICTKKTNTNNFEFRREKHVGSRSA